MSLLPCFIDESGRDERAAVFAMAGVIAHQSRWSSLEFYWRRALKDYGVTEYKFSDVIRWQRESRRNELHERLAGLLRSYSVSHLGVCLPIRTYHQSMTATGFDELVKPDLRYWHNPYTMGAMYLTIELMSEARKLLETRSEFPPGTGLNIAPVFDRCGRETDIFIETVFPQLNKNCLLNQAQHGTAKSYWELQVADFICGQYRQAAEHYLKTGAWSPTEAMQAIRPFAITVKQWNFDTYELFRNAVEPKIQAARDDLWSSQ